MDWGLITVVAAVAFLVGHLALDFRSLTRNLTTGNGGVHGPKNSAYCEHCHARARGGSELRHEAAWTVAAIVVLTGHMILDFVQRGG